MGRLPWIIQEDLKCSDVCFYKREAEGDLTQRQKRRWPCEDGSKASGVQMQAQEHQEFLATTRSWQRQGSFS